MEELTIYLRKTRSGKQSSNAIGRLLPFRWNWQLHNPKNGSVVVASGSACTRGSAIRNARRKSRVHSSWPDTPHVRARVPVSA